MPLVHLEGKRVTMRCTSCGHDTPGWEVSGGRRGRFDGEPIVADGRPGDRLEHALRKTA